MCVYIYKHASFMNARDQSLAYDPMIVHCLTNNIIVFINNNTLKIQDATLLHDTVVLLYMHQFLYLSSSLYMYILIYKRKTPSKLCVGEMGFTLMRIGLFAAQVECVTYGPPTILPNVKKVANRICNQNKRKQYIYIC